MSPSPSGFRFGSRQLFQVVLAACLGISPVTGQSILGSLQFTDKDYNALPNGSYWTPSEGAVYLQLRDDWISDGLDTKIVTLSVYNNRGAYRPDTETVALVKVPEKRDGSTGFWEGKLTLKDGSSITPSNGILETYILGDIRASVVSHKASGDSDEVISDNLLVATKDTPAAKLFLENAAGPDIPIGRTTGTLRVKVEDQSFTPGTDTVIVALRCSQSSDILHVKAIETDSGRYESQPFPKNEDRVSADATLNCRDKDIIRATYTDQNFGYSTETNHVINEPKATRLTFPKSLDDTTASGPLVEGERDLLLVRVEAYGMRVNITDSLMVVMTSAQGEREVFWAVETGPHTQVFLTQIPIAFMSTQPIVGNGILEGRKVPGTTNSPITMVASVVVDGNENKKEITLVPAQPGRVRPGGSAEDMLWWKDGVLGGQWLRLHRPRSIACFDAQGAYLGEARASGDPLVWRLPTGTGVRFVRIRALDGAGMDRILHP